LGGEPSDGLKKGVIKNEGGGDISINFFKIKLIFRRGNNA